MTDDNKIFSLKVQEALPKDVGRAIARIDPKDLKKIGGSVGDIMMLEGGKVTPVKIMPCYSEDRGKKIIQIDGIIRENVDIGLDEKVKIYPSDSSPAQKLILQPLSVVNSSGKANHVKYIGSLLEGLPVVKGNRLRTTLFGSKNCDFKVLDTYPDGVVQISSSTTITLKYSKTSKENNGSSTISYEDIGGLGNQLQKIREMIELPLRFPQVFERLGVEPPKGVLLYGPPGTGKTLIARAVAHETDSYFNHISGPEIMGKLYGESEGKLRKVFEDAKAHAPAIIFIDEIDAIAPKREDMGSEKQVERRVVAQLLACLDGIESRGQIIVIGATNIPNTIDPALRRPGRFDREISIPIPDKNGRKHILEIHTRGIPLAEDVNLDKLAEMTHGFVGADLEVLTKEAAIKTLRRILPEIDFEMVDIPYETLMSMYISMENFLDAMKEVEPSAIREFFVEVPNVKWDDVGGIDEIKAALIEAIEWPLKYSDLFKKLNTKPPKGIILHGVPGTGKTLLAKAAANESGANFISVKGPELLNRYIGESEKGVREIFKKAKQAAPTILFLDEIDSLIPIRSSGSSGGNNVTERVISQFLTEMDGIEELKGVVVLAATNRIDLIDSALLRSGRFDLMFELPLPNEKVRKDIFEIHLKGKSLTGDIDINKLVELTENMVGADIEFICRKAALLAIKEYLEKNIKKQKISNEITISQKNLINAVNIFKEQKKNKTS